jgi:hypothetical protein
MLVKEMHIAVREGIRNSPRKIELDSDRIDFHLSYVQLPFVRGRITPKVSRNGVIEGFEINQKNLGDLRTIIVKNKLVTLFIDSEADLFKGFAPPGMMYIVGARADVFYQTDCSTFSYTSTPTSHYAKKIPFDKTPVGSTNNYKELVFSLTIPGKTLVNYSITNPALQSPDDRFLLVENIMEHYRAQGQDIYWESFGEFYCPSCFIVGNLADFSATFTYKYDTNTTYNSTVESLYTGGFDSKTRAIKESLHTETNSSTRIIESEFLHRALKDNSFTGTFVDSVIVTAFDNFVGAYGDSTFAASSMKMDYVTKPRDISLKFDRSCELPEHTHEEIVDLAIKNILRSSESTFEKQVADIQLNK